MIEEYILNNRTFKVEKNNKEKMSEVIYYQKEISKLNGMEYFKVSIKIDDKIYEGVGETIEHPYYALLSALEDLEFWILKS